MATNFAAKFAKLADPTLIRRTGIPKWIAGSQFRFQKIKIPEAHTVLQYAGSYGILLIFTPSSVICTMSPLLVI